MPLFECVFLPALAVVSLKLADSLLRQLSPYPPPYGRPLPEGKGLYVIKTHGAYLFYAPLCNLEPVNLKFESRDEWLVTCDW